jgi:hypothetical protein
MIQAINDTPLDTIDQRDLVDEVHGFHLQSLEGIRDEDNAKIGPLQRCLHHIVETQV